MLQPAEHLVCRPDDQDAALAGGANTAFAGQRKSTLVAAIALGAECEEGDKCKVGEVAADSLPGRLLLQGARRGAGTPDARHLRKALQITPFRAAAHRLTLSDQHWQAIAATLHIQRHTCLANGRDT